MRYASFVCQVNLIKARLIALQKQIPVLKENETLTSAKLEKIKVINQTAVKKHTGFEQLVSKLFQSHPLPDDLDEEELSKLQDEISDLYIGIHSSCNALIASEEPRLDQSTGSAASNNNDGSSAITIKLPRLSLGTFSGQTDKWTAFHSLYESSIHKNTSISEVEKFNYLLSSLNGEPLNLIKSLPVTAVNYNLAWQILIKRYHNSRALISLHVNNLLDIPNVPSFSVKHLRNFLASYHENVGALKALDHDVTAESLILTAHLLRKFDFNFRSRFEHGRTDSQSVPNVTELIEFIERECCQLEAANLGHTRHDVNIGGSATNKAAYNRISTKAVLFTIDPKACGYCSSNEHTIYKCSEFIKLKPDSRFKYIKGKSLCTNCMGRHSNYNCKSSRNCSICNKRHHSLLHLPTNDQPQTTGRSTPHTLSYSSPQSNKGCNRIDPQKAVRPFEKSLQTVQEGNKNSNDDAAMVGTSQYRSNTVLLATALVHLECEGRSTTARAVLDSAAQHSFISEACARSLNIKRNHSAINQILGISSTPVRTKGFCHVTIAALNGHTLAYDHPVLILDKITNDLPRVKIETDIRNHLANLVLADPTFDTPAPIDVLIGADLFAQALRGGSLSLGEAMPTVFNTIFGYVLIGSTPVTSSETDAECGIVTMLSIDEANLHRTIQQFWSLEEPPILAKITPAQKACDDHFISTHTRLTTGRYQVRLPLKDSPEKLGNSSRNALSMFKSLEKRLNENPHFKNKYVNFMNDYIESGHMTECRTSLANKPHFFLPHHGVLRDDKLRVVFNASAVTTSGLSLNDLLHQGPKLHTAIPDLIFHFRRYKIVFTCDIKQMFRQIQVQEVDQLLQLIYWREDSSLPLRIFQLTTVTYGLTSSPYLANRVIQQLIADEGHHHPAAASALKRQLYVDDALLGSDTVDGALTLQQDVINLMHRGGFSLRKWSSNNPELLAAIPEDHRRIPFHFSAQDQPLCNILGLQWLPETDAFSYKVSPDYHSSTKRTVLSAISRIYDPMGWLAPVVFWAKALMQYIWTLGLAWDDSLPNDISMKWSMFLRELPQLENIIIPRHLGITANTKYQLHGFCDASESGYSACVYLRLEKACSEVSVHILMAKSRVAPLKRVSLPRLELCGAHLLANLLQYCANHLLQYIKIDHITAWCDSTIALSWIKTPSYRLKTYVANRVAQIQDISPPTLWSHIASQSNPADCASRGIYASSLRHHNLWWTGPDWLKLPQSQWPTSTYTPPAEDTLPEVKSLTLNTLATTSDHTSCDLLSKFSSWTALVRVVAYILRFIGNCKEKIKITSTLQTADLNKAITRICALIQKETFRSEISALTANKPCSTRIIRLSPFLDADGLIRVGGRLKNASINYDAKHPILLPKNHFVVDLIIDYYHVYYLHAGPHQLQALISQKFWILSARDIIRSRVHRCIKCFRCRPVLTTPYMGELPEIRVKPSRPFSASGCDYAGPFMVKPHRLRRLQPVKIYLCIFICMATKAVHIETVTDLTSESFIATLTRFSSRRGLPSHIYTDCGTSFVGAAKLLARDFHALFKNTATQRFAEERLITFHFLPPRAPHQGGLWERAVRSAKHHMKRVIGTQILTMEEFSTLVTRVESMLNSRPLTQLSADPSELDALTPGHFLVGGPLVTPAEQDLQDISMNRLRRWQHVQSLAQHIWTRWKQEYLHTLQQRSKWTKKGDNLQVGQLVVIHDSSSPSLSWKLGRITSTSPGSDGIVRVVTMKTQNGTLTRPAVKVSPLPVA